VRELEPCGRCFKCRDASGGGECIVRRRSCARTVERVLPELQPRAMKGRMPQREGDCHWEIFHPKDVSKLRAWLGKQVSSVCLPCITTGLGLGLP